MNFVYPYFLFALAAVSIPVLIHLFDLQRPKKVFFTNVHLLRNVNERTTSARKLKHFLILLSRILFITFLVLAFAKPFIKSKADDLMSGPLSTAIYIDNSLSMQNEAVKGTLLDKCIENALKLIDLFPKASKFFFLDNNFSGSDRSGVVKEKFKDRATEIQFSNTSRSFENVYRRIEDAFVGEGISASKKVFWYSDFQKSTFGDPSKIKTDSTFKIYMLPSQNTAVANLFIDSLWLDNYFVKAGDNNTISVKVRSSGGNDKHKVKLKLFSDDVQAASASTDVSANSSSIVNFDLRLTGNSLKKCRIELEDNPIKFDDQYYFTLQPSGIIQVLEISAGKNSFIKNVYGSEDNFALTQNKFGNISLPALQKAGLVIIDGFDKLNTTETNLIKQYVEKGGSILLFPSERPDPSKLTEFSSITKLPAITPSAIPNTSAIKFPDIKNPFFENVFEKNDKNTEMPVGSAIITWGGKGRKLLSLSNDEPFLSYFEINKGKVTLCSSPLSEPFTNIQKHSVFVPVMYKSAIHGSRAVGKPAYSFSSKDIAVKIENFISGDQKYTVRKNDMTFIPDQQLRDGNLYFDMPKMSMEPGFYEVMSADSIINTLAFNYDKNESLMSFYTSAELKEKFKTNKNINIIDNEVDDNFISDFRNNHIGISLWKYCLALALFFLLVEILLIRFYKQ